MLWRRSDLVITTKLYWGAQQGSRKSEIGVNELGLTRKHLYEAMRDSLKRMQLEYVDIVYAYDYFVHSHPYTPSNCAHLLTDIDRIH